MLTIPCPHAVAITYILRSCAMMPNRPSNYVRNQTSQATLASLAAGQSSSVPTFETSTTWHSTRGRALRHREPSWRLTHSRSITEFMKLFSTTVAERTAPGQRQDIEEQCKLYPIIYRAFTKVPKPTHFTPTVDPRGSPASLSPTMNTRPWSPTSFSPNSWMNS